MRYRLVVMVALVTAFALATWAGGWWTVPVVAFVAGTRERSGGARPSAIAVAAAVSWGVLLIGSSSPSAFGVLVRELAGIMAIPGAAIVLLTLAFPALLAWGAAALGGALVGGPEAAPRRVDEAEVVRAHDGPTGVEGRSVGVKV